MTLCGMALKKLAHKIAEEIAKQSPDTRVKILILVKPIKMTL